MADQKPVLLLTAGGNLSPLAPALAEHYDLIYVAQGAPDWGAPGLALLQLADADVRERADTAAAQLTAQAVAGLPTVAERLAATLPAAHPAALNSQLPGWFAGYAMRSFQWQALYLETLARVARERRIAGLLVHEDVGPDTRTAVLWARAQGLPTVHLPHAACHLMPGLLDIHREARAEYVLSSGPYMDRFYQAARVAPEKILPVGVPAWDGYYGQDLPSQAESRQVLGIPAEAPVVLYGTTWGQTTSLRSRFEAEFRETEDAVLALAKARGAFLVINLHPNEAPGNVQYYVERLQAAGVRGLVTPNHGGYCTRAADVVIKHGPSNFCIEAALIGRSSCYIQTEGFDFEHPLPPRGRAADLPRLVDEALAQPAWLWQKFISTYNVVHPDGGATERAVEAVLALCR